MMSIRQTVAQNDGLRGVMSMGDRIQLDDIAKALSLSKSTVSRAISGKGRIGEKTRAQVLNYIKEHDYRPNLIARSLAQSKTYNICVVLPADEGSSNTPFFQNCLMGVCEVAASSDYDVIVTTADNDDISLLKRIVCNKKADGVILTRTMQNDKAVEYLQQEKIPFLVIGSITDDNVIQIDTDHAAACNQITEYLLNSACKSIGIILGNMGHIVNQSRYIGFKNAFAIQKEKFNEKLVKKDLSGRISIEKAAADLVEAGADCILCGDDYICSIVLTKLGKLNVTVPDKIKVASLYNSYFLRCHTPPVTAVDINIREIGITAAQRILDLIDGKTVTPKTLLNYEIILKKSTMN